MYFQSIWDLKWNYMDPWFILTLVLIFNIVRSKQGCIFLRIGMIFEWLGEKMKNSTSKSNFFHSFWDFFFNLKIHLFSRSFKKCVQAYTFWGGKIKGGRKTDFLSKYTSLGVNENICTWSILKKRDIININIRSKYEICSRFGQGCIQYIFPHLKKWFPPPRS